MAMCRHSTADVEGGLVVEMRYPRVTLIDWQHLEAAARVLMRRYRTVSP